MTVCRKQSSIYIIVRVLIAVGAAGVMTLLMLGPLLAAAEPAHTSSRLESAGLKTVDSDSPWDDEQVMSPAVLPPAQKGGITTTGRTIPLPDWAKELLAGDRIGAADANISVSKSANTKTVFDGNFITYTIIVTNHTPNVITDVTVLDIIPRDDQGNIQLDEVDAIPACAPDPNCSLIRSPPVTTVQPGGTPVPGPPGPVTRIEWLIPSLPSGTTEFVFKGRVACQPVGAILKNRALFSYNLGGGSSNELTTQVLARPIDESGDYALASEPVWCSSNVFGAYDLDGGDFDGDGDLDIAIGTPYQGGTIVFRNDGNQFTQIWDQPIFTYGVSWIDADRNGTLELLSVGNWDSVAGCCRGINYLYDQNGAQIDQFYSDNGFFRIAPADYNSDGYIDLATTIFWTADVGGIDCKVRLYENEGPPNYFPPYSSTNTTCLFSESNSTRARVVAWGDYDNNGYPDLALGKTNGAINLFPNAGSPTYLSSSNVITIDSSLSSNPWDIAWGDYDSDGYLDLAVVFPFNSPDGLVRVYHNNNGTSWTSTEFNIPYSIHRGLSWGDFDQDNQLDLAVGNVIYQHMGAGTFSPTGEEANVGVNTIYRVRSLDYDNDGDLDLTLANNSSVSALFASFSPVLVSNLSSVGPFEANSISWGDADGDNALDLLFGVAAGSSIQSRLYENNQANFSLSRDLLSFNGTGPHSGAFGDVDGDGSLEIAIGSSNGLQVYINNDEFPDWDYSTSTAVRSLAWGDVEGDGDLDLLAGTNGPNLLFFNQGTGLAASPGWQSTSEPDDDTRSVAWGDYNNDFYLDFATGNANRPTRVYRNNKNNTFSLAWSSPYSWDTRSVAWGDYDQDGDLDLAVGNYNQPNLIYRNQGGTFSQDQSWPLVTETTTSLAWGDWDNDGDLDLAVGNEDHQDRVYNNLNEETGSPTLVWRWTSPHNHATTGLAWGDQDGDGDLDLAVSRSDGNSGVYENSYVSPSHLTTVFTLTMPLPNNPSYLSIDRPGSTETAYFFSSAEVLNSSIIPIPFTVFDPDGTRSGSILNALGDDLISLADGNVLYEYSVNGGGKWQSAAQDSLVGGDSGKEDTRREGQSYIFNWDAAADEVIGDNIRFRISIINHIGPTQDSPLPGGRTGLNRRARVNAVSPPFRIRPIITNCSWPSNPSFTYDPLNPAANSPIDFFGNATNIGGSGNFTFTWDFGDGEPPPDDNPTQDIQYTYAQNGVYTVTLTVSGEPCPVPYEVIVSQPILVGPSILSTTYLPLVQKSGVTGVGTETGPEAGGQPFTLAVTPESPAQVTGLTGSTLLETGVTRLDWSLSPPEDAVLGYRVYRATGSGPAYLQVELPANISTYTDDTATCDQSYFVTAYDSGGESLPSTTTYFSPTCRPPAPPNPPAIELGPID